MNESDEDPLARLEALSREVEALANEVAVRARAFGPEAGARSRVDGVRMRLRVAFDELDAYPHTADDITDE